VRVQISTGIRWARRPVRRAARDDDANGASPGHGQTAARLQRDWGQDPEALSFAPHVQTHALIALVQKGLQFYDLERSIDQARRPPPARPSTRPC
jgi:hypothetical protein